MLLGFFTQLRAAKIPVTLREYLTLLEGLDKDLAARSVEDFYYLSRSCLVKDERFLDRFDRVFSSHFKAITRSGDAFEDTDIPKEWLEKLAERHLDPKEREAIKALGWDKLWETLAERLKEQKGRHQGGSKWIGTAGTSPFGAYGTHKEGIRIGQEGNR
ncbi:MAG: VWA domain-containing protein, partial [Rhizobiales bacterium]|nr:VWA domain-containing protein [Hyphomicrobiales bacterium]